MKANLIRINKEYFYYDSDNNKVLGIPSGIRGDLTNVSGDLSGIRGDLSDCDIIDEDRIKGIDIEDLIAK